MQREEVPEQRPLRVFMGCRAGSAFRDIHQVSVLEAKRGKKDERSSLGHEHVLGLSQAQRQAEGCLDLLYLLVVFPYCF